MIKCNGAGGQSFGAFIPKGLTLELVGDSNDYFGKGLSGGKLIVYPPKGIKYQVRMKTSSSVTWHLYGATSGKALYQRCGRRAFLRPKLRCNCSR